MMGESAEAQASGNPVPAAELLGALIHLARQPDSTLPDMRAFVSARAGNAVFLKMSLQAMQFGMELRRLDSDDNFPRKSKDGEIMRRVIIFGPASQEVANIVTMNGRFKENKLPPALRLLFAFYEVYCRRNSLEFTRDHWREEVLPAVVDMRD